MIVPIVVDDGAHPGVVVLLEVLTPVHVHAKGEPRGAFADPVVASVGPAIASLGAGARRRRSVADCRSRTAGATRRATPRPNRSPGQSSSAFRSTRLLAANSEIAGAFDAQLARRGQPTLDGFTLGVEVVIKAIEAHRVEGIVVFLARAMLTVGYAVQQCVAAVE